MDKDLIKYSYEVEDAKESFYNHLKKCIGEDLFDKISSISESANVYIFSGVIRDYFLSIPDARDIDIVVDGNVNVEDRFKEFRIDRNSFGGYKIYLDSLVIDLWQLKDTWMLKKVPVLFNNEGYIPHTAFFNFSSIIYHLNQKEFYYTEYFLRFLKTRKIDVVNPVNPNYGLCIVNSFYYSDKLGYKMSHSLKKNIVKWYQLIDSSFDEIQQKHFGKVVYSTDEIKQRVETLSLQLLRKKKRVILLDYLERSKCIHNIN